MVFVAIFKLVGVNHRNSFHEYPFISTTMLIPLASALESFNTDSNHISSNCASCLGSEEPESTLPKIQIKSKTFLLKKSVVDIISLVTYST